MAKLAIYLLLLTLTASLVLANAHLTTVVVNEEESPKGMSCHEQFGQQQNLKHCQMYMMQEMKGGRRCHGGRCDYELNKQQHFQRCCDQLEEMDSMCRCEGLQQMMRMMGEEMSEDMQIARNLPSMCNLCPCQCQFGFGRRNA